MLSELGIIDGHCHVASTDFIPEDFLSDVAGTIHLRLTAYGQKTTKEKITEMVLKQNVDHLADALVKEMDAAGVVQSVLLVPDFSAAMKCKLTSYEMAAAHFKIKQRHPGRFRVFLGVNPELGQQAVDDFEAAVNDFEIEGLKLYPPCGYSPSDESLFPFYEVCKQHGLPVLSHTGPSAQRLDFRLGHPLEMEGAARTFPSVNFILAHGGVSYVRPSLELCKYRENVFVDIGGFSGGALPMGWEAHLKDLFAMGMNHKIIYGSDWPLSRMSGGMKLMINKLEKIVETMPLAEAKLIFRDTMTRLLPPPSTRHP